MKNLDANDKYETYSALAKAKALVLPTRQEMLDRAPSVQRFWLDNRNLLEQAWLQWESDNTSSLPSLTDTVLDKSLKEAVEQAWLVPRSESAVRDLWHEVSPGVYKAPFFDPEKLAPLRDYLEQVADAEIPLRPPYGIALNRHGAMLDARSEGYLAAPEFQKLYQQLVDRYLRPIARMLMPEVMGYDSQSFGFSIQYQAGMDTSLRLHTDASAVTMNINMNLPGENYKGSEVDFYDAQTGRVNRLIFEPGTAMIHRGNIAHAAQPIREGERSNLVLWLYGEGMQIPHHQIDEAIEPEKRWTTPTTPKDQVAPF